MKGNFVHDRLLQVKVHGGIIDDARRQCTAVGISIPELVRATLRAAAQGRIAEPLPPTVAAGAPN